MREQIKNIEAPEELEKKLYDEVDLKQGENFYSNFAGRNIKGETGGYRDGKKEDGTYYYNNPNSEEIKYVERIAIYRKQCEEILNSSESRDVKNLKIWQAKKELIIPAIARMKQIISGPGSLNGLTTQTNKEVYDAITNILAATGEIGKYLDEIKKFRETLLSGNNTEYDKFINLSI